MRLYLDEDSLGRWLRDGLRKRGFDVETVFEARTIGFKDEAQLSYAHDQQRTIVTGNQADFARLHRDWSRVARPHAGIIICPQLMSPGRVLAAFEALRVAYEGFSLENRIEFLSNWAPRG